MIIPSRCCVFFKSSRLDSKQICYFLNYSSTPIFWVSKFSTCFFSVLPNHPLSICQVYMVAKKNKQINNFLSLTDYRTTMIDKQKVILSKHYNLFEHQQAKQRKAKQNKQKRNKFLERQITDHWRWSFFTVFFFNPSSFIARITSIRSFVLSTKPK